MIFSFLVFAEMKNAKEEKTKKIIYIPKRVEFPKKDGVAPASEPKNIFLNKPKYCTIASKPAKTPAIKCILIKVFQNSPLTKIAIKIEKIKKNNTFNIPPVLAGEPNTLNRRSCENTVDTIKTIT